MERLEKSVIWGCDVGREAGWGAGGGGEEEAKRRSPGYAPTHPAFCSVVLDSATALAWDRLRRLRLTRLVLVSGPFPFPGRAETG